MCVCLAAKNHREGWSGRPGGRAPSHPRCDPGSQPSPMWSSHHWESGLKKSIFELKIPHTGWSLCFFLGDMSPLAHFLGGNPPPRIFPLCLVEKGVKKIFAAGGLSTGYRNGPPRFFFGPRGTSPPNPPNDDPDIGKICSLEPNTR